MNKHKILLKNILHTIYGFFSACYTPSFLNVTFNFTHGIANNPDGAIFILFGIIIILSILAIDISIIVKNIKSYTMSKTEKVVTIFLFVLIKFIGLMVDKDGWRNFIHCFEWKFV